MTVDSEVSLAIIREEIAECDPESFGWTIGEPDASNLSFQVTMTAKNKEVYHLHVGFDNYKQSPLLLDFYDPQTGKVGAKNAYPSDKKNFFNKTKVVICHPCNRKAYAGYTGIHSEWDLSNWKSNPGVGQLTRLCAILEAIHCRLTNDDYEGRMV